MNIPRRGVLQTKPGVLSFGTSVTSAVVLLSFLFLFAGSADAQGVGRITGRVADAQGGTPLGEVQVFIVGQGLGALTGSNGRFLIPNVAPGTYQLRAERIGLAGVSQQVTVSGGQTIEVSFEMTTQALGLDEIVVTGTAGAARRREIGNTIAQIRPSDLPSRPTDVQELLRGAAPGLNISSSAGDMGMAQAIRLRGVHSVNMSNTPIIYIDGVRIRSQATPLANAVDFRSQRGDNVQVSPLAQLNPSDIERIEVIKGSAATTLYGTEASAGVIQIFTKSGATGATVWTFESSQGAVWSRKFGMDIDISGTPECERTQDCNLEYFRWRPYLKTGYNPSYSASVRGGGQTLQYFVSGGFEESEGVLENEYGEKWLTRGNFSVTPLNGLQVVWTTAYTHSWMQNVSQSNSQGYGHNVVRGLANFFANDRPEVVNQVLDYDIQSWIDRLTTGATVTYSPLSNLTNRLTIGYDFIQKDTRNLRPFGFFGGVGQLLTHNWQDKVLTFDFVGTLNFQIRPGLRSSLSWGGQAVGDEEYTLEGWGENFPGATSPTVSSAASRQGFETRSKVWNAGFFLQNVFDIQDRYFLTAGLRVDGNSAFGEGFGLQTYPKLSGSWVLSDESFWQPGWGVIKLRAAYGQSGRAPGAFDAVRTWTADGSFLGRPAFVPLNRGNPSLGPEVTAEMESGFDASWLEDRLQLDFTYYRSTTSDALLRVAGVPSEGFSGSQLENVGKLRNSGIEIALNASPIQRTRWGWDLGVNVTTNESEVLDLGGRTSIGDDAILGQPIAVVRGRYVANADEFAQPVIEQNHVYGPGNPTLILAPSTSIRLPGGITLAARGEYKAGHYYRDGNIESGAVQRSATVPSCWSYYANKGVDNRLVPVDQIPALGRARCTPSLTQADYFTYEADFFRMRALSATIPIEFLVPQRVTSATLSLSLNNSFTWKAMPILDPELGQNGASESLSIGSSPRLPPPIQFVASLRLQL
jgi:outer membrane receptor protein involved in Fe transport